MLDVDGGCKLIWGGPHGLKNKKRLMALAMVHYTEARDTHVIREAQKGHRNSYAAVVRFLVAELAHIQNCSYQPAFPARRSMPYLGHAERGGGRGKE